MADIRKQPSPVMQTTRRSGRTRWAPMAAGIAQPMLWLSAGVKYRRGPWTSIASEAQCVEAVTSTKTSSSGPRTSRNWASRNIGSTHGCDADGQRLAAIDLPPLADVLPERGAGGAADRLAVGQEPVQEDPGIGVDADVRRHVPAQVLGVDVDVDQRPGLGDRVVGGRDLAVADADRQHEIHVLERRLGGAGALLAVSPADGQGMGVGDAPLAADRRGHRRLEQLGDGGQRRAGVDAAQPGVDPDPSPAVGQVGQRPGRRPPRRTATG